MKVLYVAIGVLAAACFALFTSTTKVLPHIFHALILLWTFILGGSVDLFAALHERTSKERAGVILVKSEEEYERDTIRIVIACFTVALLLITIALTFWDYLRFRKIRDVTQITEVCFTFIGALLPFGFLAMVTLFFLDTCYLEGVILLFGLVPSSFLAYHVWVLRFTKWRFRRYEQRLDRGNLSESNDANDEIDEIEMADLRSYQTDAEGITHPWSECLGFPTRLTFTHFRHKFFTTHRQLQDEEQEDQQGDSELPQLPKNPEHLGVLEYLLWS